MVTVGTGRDASVADATSVLWWQTARKNVHLDLSTMRMDADCANVWVSNYRVEKWAAILFL